MRMVVAQDGPEQSEQVRKTLLGLGLECAAGDCVSFHDLPVRLSQGPVDLVMIRMTKEPTPALAAIRQAVALSPAPVLALGPASDPQYILQTGRNGAREYLDEERLQEDLEAALEKLRSTGAVKHGQGAIISVVSPTPGSGVTTVASNLAFIWAHQYPDQVALIELGREAPALALNLDLDPRHTVVEVAQQWPRMDAALLRQSMVAHSGGVGVLAYKPETLRTDGIEPAAVRKLVILLRTMHVASVLDLGHTLAEEHFEAMRLSDMVNIIVRLDVPALRQARQLVKQLIENGVSYERIRLVANRYGERGQLAWKKAEEALGAKFAEYIPDDNGKLNYALNQGKPLVRVAPFCRVARHLNKLAGLLIGRR